MGKQLVNFKKLSLFFLTLVILIPYVNNVYAIEPSYIVELPPEAKFYINRNGGISHNTYVVETGDKQRFFKACKEKLTMYDTAKRAITEYFKDNYKNDQQSMLKSLTNEENLKKFIHMKTYDDGQAAKWLKLSEKSDTSVLGFTEPLSDEFKTKELPQFLHYAFAEFVQYRANRNREIGDLQLNQLLGSLATMRIAELLGLSNLVVKTEYVKIITSSGTDKLGIIMDCAKGVPFKNLKTLKNKSVSPSFQLSASNLMILDAICAQRDRSVGNYFTILSDENNIIGINAFDNDLSFDGFINLKKRDSILPPIINSDGTIILPHMDKTLANRILSLNDKDICLCLKDLLNDGQIDATINRFHQIQRAIRETIKINPKFLLECSEWNKTTIEEELSIDNDTYFKYFMNKLAS